MCSRVAARIIRVVEIHEGGGGARLSVAGGGGFVIGEISIETGASLRRVDPIHSYRRWAAYS